MDIFARLPCCTATAACRASSARACPCPTAPIATAPCKTPRRLMSLVMVRVPVCAVDKSPDFARGGLLRCRCKVPSAGSQDLLIGLRLWRTTGGLGQGTNDAAPRQLDLERVVRVGLGVAQQQIRRTAECGCVGGLP